MKASRLADLGNSFSYYKLPSKLVVHTTSGRVANELERKLRYRKLVNKEKGAGKETSLL